MNIPISWSGNTFKGQPRGGRFRADEPMLVMCHPELPAESTRWVRNSLVLKNLESKKDTVKLKNKGTVIHSTLTVGHRGFGSKHLDLHPWLCLLKVPLHRLSLIIAASLGRLVGIEIGTPCKTFIAHSKCNAQNQHFIGIKMQDVAGTQRGPQSRAVEIVSWESGTCTAFERWTAVHEGNKKVKDPLGGKGNISIVWDLNHSQGRARFQPPFCHSLAVWSWESSFTSPGPGFPTPSLLGCPGYYIPSQDSINCRWSKGRLRACARNGGVRGQGFCLYSIFTDASVLQQKARDACCHYSMNSRWKRKAVSLARVQD